MKVLTQLLVNVFSKQRRGRGIVKPTLRFEGDELRQEKRSRSGMRNGRRQKRRIRIDIPGREKMKEAGRVTTEFVVVHGPCGSVAARFV